ncbi:hypothetical protein Tco_1286010 [Tanacetum coccineum]
MVVQNQAELGEGSAIPTDPHHTPTIIPPSTQPQKTQKPRKPKRKDNQVPQPSSPTKHVADEVVHKELGDSLVRAVTTASSLEAKQDSGNITKTRSKEIPNEAGSLVTNSGCGPSDEESLSDDATKQGKINAIDVDEKITLVSVHNDDEKMFDVGTMTGDEVFAEQEVAARDVNLTVDEVTLALALQLWKCWLQNNCYNSNSRKGNCYYGLVGFTPTITKSSQKPSQAKVYDKGKGKMIKPEPVKKMSKKDQLRSDEEEAKRLQAEFDKEERLAREKDEGNIALTKQEELSVEEKAKLFQQLLEQRRKHFAAKSAEERRNKQPTQAQQRKIMCTYLKNMEGKKLKDLKNKSFDSIRKMFDKDCQSRRWHEDKDTADSFKGLIGVIPDEEEVTINVVSLDTKPLMIFDWKIHKEEKNRYFQIIRDDGSSKMYLVFKDEIWKLQQRYKVLSWKLFDSCGGHCLSLKSDKEPIKIRDFPPTDVKIDKWKKLCDHFASEKHLKRSRSSKVNMSKQLYSSNQGTKSYEQRRYEEFNEETNEFPDLIDHFRAKHMKGGKWNNTVAEERYNKMIELREAQKGRDTPLIVDHIMSQVLGVSRGFKPRRGRTLLNSASASASCSAHSDPPMMSQEAWARSFVANQDQIAQIYQIFVNNNMQVPVTTLLNPTQFMDVVRDPLKYVVALEDDVAREDGVAPGDE